MIQTNSPFKVSMMILEFEVRMRKGVLFLRLISVVHPASAPRNVTYIAYHVEFYHYRSIRRLVSTRTHPNPTIVGLNPKSPNMFSIRHDASVGAAEHRRTWALSNSGHFAF